MTTITKFMAEDGTMFDNCGECQIYEDLMRNRNNPANWGFDAFNGRFHFIIDLEELYDVEYVYIKDSSVAEEILNFIYDKWGWGVPTEDLEDDTWYYWTHDGDGGWENLTERIEETKMIIDALGIDI